MTILILNWRDIKHPAAGGAEILTHEIAKGLIRKGHQVVQISSNFPEGKKKETIDGVMIIRLGRWWSVHLLAFFYYFSQLHNKTDIIIDEVHWFPFFSILYARKKTVLLACEVANKLFFNICPYPLAVLGRCIEKIYLSLYRNAPAMVISPSTKDDLIKEGHKGRIIVLPMGVSVPMDVKILHKEKNPTIIYLGRLVKQKGIEDALEVFEKVKKEVHQAVLWIVGTGTIDYIDQLEKKAKKISSDIVFFGFVSEKKKFELLSKAHVLIVPSIHEGWGLVVPEAGVVGTPAVVYDVNGLKDIIDNGINGFRVLDNPSEMANKVIRILMNSESYHFMRNGAINRSKIYDWSKTSDSALEFIYSIKRG